MSKTRMSKIVSLLLVALFVFTACGSGAGAGGMDTVTVQLDYQLRGDHGMFYVAQKLGYFKAQGINVKTIITGNGSPNALRTVGRGQADFGFADLPSLVTARTQHVPVKALAAVNQVSPLGMCSLADRLELTNVRSLEGHTVGIDPAGSTFIFYKALLAKNKVDRGKVQEATVTPPYENYLLQKKVDAIVCYIDAEVPILEKAAGGKGSLSILLGGDAGYDAYGSGLVTSDKLIEQKRSVVQRFTNAYLKAFAYVERNPQKTAQILAASSPVQKKNEPLFASQLQADIQHTFTSPRTKADGMGAMDAKRWQATIDVLAAQGVLKGKPPAPSSCYDESFIQKYYAKN